MSATRPPLLNGRPPAAPDAPQDLADTRPGAPWDVIDVAEYLGISERTLRALIADGTVQCIRFGRRVKISDQEVRRLATQGTG